MGEPSLIIKFWGLSIQAVGVYGVGAVIVLALLVLAARWMNLF